MIYVRCVYIYIRIYTYILYTFSLYNYLCHVVTYDCISIILASWDDDDDVHLKLKDPDISIFCGAFLIFVR